MAGLEEGVYLRVSEMIERSGGSVEDFFKTAYLWRFNKYYHCMEDAYNFRLYQKIPPYVIDFTKHSWEDDED